MTDRPTQNSETFPGEARLGQAITRKEFVAAGAATTFGLLLAACGGSGDGASAPAPPAEPTTPDALPEPSPSPTPAPSEEAPLTEGLAEGMYGGPTGFEGAERYQYPFDSEEGRAIAALRRLRQNGTAPDTLVVQINDFVRPQLETSLAPGVPSLIQLFHDETGIRIRLIDASIAFFDNLQAAESRDGSIDVVVVWTGDMATLAEVGLLSPFDEFVEAYRPSWLDPHLGYAGGEPIVNYYNTYKGRTYRVALDNGAQLVAYRADLLEDPAEQANFGDRYGRQLRFPLTWDEQAEVAEFFTRPDRDPPLYGSVERKDPLSGWVNWANRFLSSDSPVLFYLNNDGSANVNNDAGIRAAEEHKRSLRWSEPGALENEFPVQWQLMGEGSGFMGGTWQAVFLVQAPEAPFSEHLRAEVSPGRVVDGGLIRRSTDFAGLGAGVNAFANTSHQEASYLFLQWAGSARIHAWLSLNRSGFGGLDPFHTSTLDDPLVAEIYGEQPQTKMKEVMPRTAPGAIPLQGGFDYQDALRDELHKYLTDDQTVEQAMKNLEGRWNALTEEIGVESQVEALKHLSKTFPTTVDDPPGA